MREFWSRRLVCPDLAALRPLEMLYGSDIGSPSFIYRPARRCAFGTSKPKGCVRSAASEKRRASLSKYEGKMRGPGGVRRSPNRASRL